MKKIFVLFAFLALYSCEQQKVNLEYLPGYWEISKAENREGKSKEFKINESIDYIVLNDSTGFRKKLKPQFSGKYKGSKDLEELRVIRLEGKTKLEYTTPYDSWQEEIIELTDEKLIVENESGIRYTYLRYKGLMEFDEEE